MNYRIGFGYDVHRLEEGKTLVIGGVHIPHDKGAVGHSDADVLIHAICDALLGAVSLRDIGYHFPDTSNEYKDIDSRILLTRTIKLLEEHGYKTGNIDSTVCLEKPKIKDYIPEMISELTKTTGINKSDISIKATTNEKLGFIGREEGVAAYAVAMVYKINK